MYSPSLRYRADCTTVEKQNWLSACLLAMRVETSMSLRDHGGASPSADPTTLFKMVQNNERSPGKFATVFFPGISAVSGAFWGGVN